MQTYHLYSDGNYFPRAKKSGFGGYITKPNGEVLVEYTEQIRKPEYAHSFELLGIIRGLELAKTHGIQSIISHCDDKNTASKLKEIFEENIFNVGPSLKPELFQQVIELSKSFKNIKFEYIPRNQNKYADVLSRKYAGLMEENFLRQQDSDLFKAHNKFKHNLKTSKRIFFSHANIINSPHKNNPFMVAPFRNKKVRKLVKEEKTHDYFYLFTEFFKKDNNVILKSTLYDSNQKNCGHFEQKTPPTQEQSLNIYSEHLSLALQKFKTKTTKIWINSNHNKINNIFEQKEKIHETNWDSLLKVHKALDSYDRIFFNYLPFEPTYTPENQPTENQKKKLDREIESLEALMEKLNNGILNRDKNKYFGAIIRHELKKYQDLLSRELNTLEKNQLIADTRQELKEKGLKF